MSEPSKNTALWIINVVLVPICSFFLWKTYDRLEAMQEVQVQTQINVATIQEAQRAQGMLINNLGFQMRDLGRKIDNLKDDPE